MPLQEYVARWQGARIGAGASVFHFESVASSAAAVTIASSIRAMFDALKAALPDDVTISFDPEVKELSEAGVLLGVYPITPPANVEGTNASGFVNGAGLLVRHNTGVILGGKRILGRTFFVPVSSASFNESGDVLATTVTAFQSAFLTMNNAVAGVGADFVVWSRANTATANVQSSTVVNRPTNLKTRNDRV